MASAASSEPADRELAKRCPFSKGEWADAYPVDLGFGNIYQLFETPENVGFDSLTALGLLAVAYAAGEHEKVLSSGPECFLATWGSKAEARSIRPPETGAAATNAYDTAMTATDSYAARVAVKVAKATQGAMSLVGSVRNLGVSEVSPTRFCLIKKSGLLTPGQNRPRAIRTRLICF